MTKYHDRELLRIKRLLNWYNMIPNVAWSVLNLVPVSIYCYNRVGHRSLYIFIAVSVIPGFSRIHFSTGSKWGEQRELIGNLE